MKERDTENGNGDASEPISVGLQPSDDWPSWATMVRSPTGVGRPLHVPKPELRNVVLLLADMERQLASPPTAADHVILGELGVHLLRRFRLAREGFRSTRAKGGELRGSQAELRATSRLLLDLLSHLKFRSGTPRDRVVDIRELWNAQAAEQATQTSERDRSPVEAAARVLSDPGGSGGQGDADERVGVGIESAETEFLPASSASISLDADDDDDAEAES